MTDEPAPGPLDAQPSTPYRVLARKYRPTSFAGLIGQEALVRTLSNAIAAQRLAHAFILTGVRGVGKTTTARIIARALNCVGPDGAGGPTAEPCGVCEHCAAIGQDRHVDVIEMDAASRTGIDDIRELTGGVHYLPVRARFKVYIIDEVHMLSEKAFNALLKTLEEPPEHVKFIFATTEIRKVPVTVLSRCQRFDLRRVPSEILMRHFDEVARQEGAILEPEALALIARAADGSVRDGLSILDQAIAHTGAAPVGADAVRAMLGLADRIQVFDLLEALLGGRTAEALDRFAAMHEAGADAIAVLQDLLDLTHWLTRIKILPDDAGDPTVAEAERVRGRRMAEALDMPVLTRAWQMLLKGLGEAQHAPAPRLAVEMLFVRMAYAAGLPTPAELLARVENGGALASASPPPAPVRPAPSAGGAAPRPAPQPAIHEPATGAPAPADLPAPRSFGETVALFEERGEMILHAHLCRSVHLVSFRPGRIELRPTEQAPPNLAAEVSARLGRWTGERWIVTLSREAGEPSLAEQTAAHQDRLRAEAADHPLVRAALTAFPGATIAAVRERPPGADAPSADLPEPDLIEDEDAQ